MRLDSPGRRCSILITCCQSKVVRSQRPPDQVPHRRHLFHVGFRPTLPACRDRSPRTAMAPRDQTRGFRMSARIERERVQLLPRTGTRLEPQISERVEALVNLGAKTAYLDGELCGIGDDGLPSFSNLRRHGSGQSARASRCVADLQCFPEKAARRPARHHGQFRLPLTNYPPGHRSAAQKPPSSSLARSSSCLARNSKTPQTRSDKSGVCLASLQTSTPLQNGIVFRSSFSTANCAA